MNRDTLTILFGHAGELFIGGRWVAPLSGWLIEVVSPATEEVYVKVAAAGPQYVQRLTFG